MIKLASSEMMSTSGDLIETVNGRATWFEQGLKRFPDDTRMFYAMALSYWLQGDVTNARSTMESYAKAVPGDGAARFVLGDIAYSSGDITTALQIWSGERNGMVFIEQAREALDLGNLDEAQQLFDVALTTDISSYSIAYRLAEQYSRLAAAFQSLGSVARMNQACDSGTIAYESAIEAEPTWALPRISFGGFLRQCNRYDGALQQLLAADAVANTSNRAWVNHEIALTYFAQEEAEKALGYFEKAVLLDPSHGGYRIMLGSRYVDLGMIDQAVEQFSLAAESDSPAWQSWASIEEGKLHYSLGDYERAQVAFEQSLGFESNRDDAKILLGKVLLKMGEQDAARVQFEEASSSNNPEWRRWALDELDTLQ